MENTQTPPWRCTALWVSRVWGLGLGGLGVQGVRGLGFRVGLKGLGLDGFPPF